MWCAMSEDDDNTNFQEDHVHIHLSSVTFHVHCVGLGCHVVIGVVRLIVRLHHAYAISSFLLGVVVQLYLAIVNSDCSHNYCLLHGVVLKLSILSSLLFYLLLSSLSSSLISSLIFSFISPFSVSLFFSLSLSLSLFGRCVVCVLVVCPWCGVCDVVSVVVVVVCVWCAVCVVWHVTSC